MSTNLVLEAEQIFNGFSGTYISYKVKWALMLVVMTAIIFFTAHDL